jgi:hypothetical protein
LLVDVLIPTAAMGSLQVLAIQLQDEHTASVQRKRESESGSSERSSD